MSFLRRSESLKTYSLMSDVKRSTTEWFKIFKSSFDPDNCSSNSISFYTLFFILGTIEMVFSICLAFGYELVSSNKPSDYSVNKTLFMSALSIEFVFWLISRMFLIRAHIRTHSRRRLRFTKFFIPIIQSILTFFPSDMLLFFGYEGNQRFSSALLNFSWVRRIVSTVRISIQIAAIKGILEGEFITTVFCSYIFYLTVLLTAICPQSSSYDHFAWYRKF